MSFPKNPLAMPNRRVLVTGASSGLGRSIALLLAELGCRVTLCARDGERLAAVKAELQGEGHTAESFDLANVEAIPAWFKSLADRDGAFHGVVHSAGVLTTKPLKLLGPADWDKALRVNVVSASALAKGFRQRGVCADGGSIVLLASVMGIVGQPGQSLYSATKGALIGMTRSLALELARENIRINCVAPAVVMAGMSEQLKQNVSPEQFAQITAMHPLGLGRGEDVANAVAFLLADTARWITGTTLVVDGGYTAH